MRVQRLVSIVSIILCGAGLAIGQTVWQDYADNPVIASGDVGPWAPEGAWISSVVFDGTTYHMFFTGVPDASWIGDNDIGHATSADGVDWTMDPANPVLTRGASGEWDDIYVLAGAVIHDGTTFHMWYTGAHEGPNNIGYASSPDGSTWTKHPDNPVMLAGSPGTWNDEGVSTSAVMIEDGTYKMWFEGADDTVYVDTTWRVGYAESSDGIEWSQLPDPVLEPGGDGAEWTTGLWSPSVVHDGSSYHMWFAGDLPNAHPKVGYAYSTDGIEWTMYRDNPVVEMDANISSAPVIFDGTTYHMWYTHNPGGGVDASVAYATSQCCDLYYRHFIPAAALAGGSAGAFFMTDVDVSNAGNDPAEYLLKWLPRGQVNNDPLTSERFSLGADMSVRYENIVAEVFGLEPDAVGAIMIEAGSPDLLFMSRTYNNPSEGTGGTFGQAIPAIPAQDFIQGGEKRRIVFGSENANSRFNVGCQNGSDNTALVQLELFAADGTSLETKMMVLSAWSNDQLNRIFEDHRPVTGCVDVWATGADNSIYCYGSLLDNTTNDPTTIPPQ